MQAFQFFFHFFDLGVQPLSVGRTRQRWVRLAPAETMERCEEGSLLGPRLLLDHSVNHASELEYQ